MNSRRLQTILVALDDSSYSDSAITLALEWAACFGARLIGLGILDKPSITAPEPIPLGASAFRKGLEEKRLAAAQEHLRQLLARFQERCAAADVPAHVVEDVGDPTKCILRQAHLCDVIILGYQTQFRFETQDSPDTVRAKVLRRSPRPIAVVPRELSSGDGVVVAYGGGREVARTLQTFQLLGLARDETVHLLSIRGDDEKIVTAAELAAEFLRAHGEKCQLHVLKSDMPPAEVILGQVRKLQPRLVVMGAHAHHSLRDLFATSVTRAVLADCPVPVLIGS